ncbi:MAG: hypothetical protein IPK27_03275 [Rhodanobacteraceae bacterium]|nr:hypothetical protein [Rhodanobacteraceae bacterium]
MRSIEEYENEPIRRRPEQSPGWINALASCDQARAEIRNETEASRELREDLRAADALVRRLNEFERIYGVSEGDAGRTVLVKLLIGTLKSNGRTYRPGESFQLDEPTALGLASRRVVEIMGA